MSDTIQQDSSENLRLPAGESDGQWTFILIDGQRVKARAGEILTAALWAAGIRVLRHTDETGAPRGLFCGMGMCFDCIVTIDGKPRQRACLTLVQPGMQVETEGSWPSK